MKFTSRKALVGVDTSLYRISEGEEFLSHRKVIEFWRNHAQFSLFYSGLLQECGFKGFCWEMPPLTKQTIDEPHEFVIVKSSGHESLVADPSPFKEHFSPSKLATSFPNLGKNGIMIAPTPQGELDAGSIATFLRTASETQKVAIWKLTAEELSNAINAEPIWISTAGLGVSWLHIRLDSRPKYYRYPPYKNRV